jgi:hypothetical protein
MIDTAVGMLTVPELEAMISLNVDLAARYQMVANDPGAEPGTRRTAEALAVWRRARARYFRRECADTELVEAAHELDPCPPLAGLPDQSKAWADWSLARHDRGHDVTPGRPQA